MRKTPEIFIVIAAPAWRRWLTSRRWFSETNAGPPNYAYSARQPAPASWRNRIQTAN